jgi:DNA helicase-2/ATP-dependent DNA helicase PcrA
MTLHTAKGLEFRAVFLTGIEEELLPHKMSAGEPGGPAEERRLFYVGITRARERLYLSLAMTRAQYGDTSVSAPSRFLGEVPAHLVEWRQSPGAAGPGPRAVGSLSWSTAASDPPLPKAKTEWTNRVTNKMRDNGDLELAVGDRIRHDDFGEGRVASISGVAAKRIAEVHFDTAGRKRLLIKVAPITKL